MEKKNLSAIGQEILYSCRNELYMNLPYLDTALCSLEFVPGEGVTASLATDGRLLYYTGSFVAERYLRGTATVNRLYLHVILHCLLRHPWKTEGKDPTLWDLACDTAVESILDSLPYSCIKAPDTPVRKKFYGECLQEMKVLTAEGIYRKLLRDRRPPYELAQLQREVLGDDHGLWNPDKNDRNEENENNWKNMAATAQTGMETVLSREAQGGEQVLEQIRISTRDEVDYRSFLRRFSAPREVMKSDDDAFDYAYYTYGLSHYGNMPLIEPPETKEEKRIEDLVIAIDTSMSTSGELVREFLNCTFGILKSTDTFTRKLNIHILQCDDRVRSDTAIGDLEDLKKYTESFELKGGSATDFRPVFDYIRELKKQGEFKALRGLLYFTDGMGIYPTARPDYETAFIFLEQPPLSVKIPPWCIRIMLSEDALEQAVKELGDDWYDRTEEMPEL